VSARNRALWVDGSLKTVLPPFDSPVAARAAASA
jgi:hypothetical protein